MKKTIHQEIIDFIDEKGGATYFQVCRRFDNQPLALAAFVHFWPMAKSSRSVQTR